MKRIHKLKYIYIKRRRDLFEIICRDSNPPLLYNNHRRIFSFKFGGLNNLHVCTVYIFQKEIFVGATIDFGGFNPPNCAYDNNFMLCQCNWVAFQYNNLFGKFNAFNLRRRRNIIISRVTTYLTLLLYYITMYYYGCMYI